MHFYVLSIIFKTKRERFLVLWSNLNMIVDQIVKIRKAQVNQQQKKNKNQMTRSDPIQNGWI